MDEQPSHLTEGTVRFYLDHGLTPAVVEHAYRTSTVRELVARYGAYEEDVRALADRWHIKRRGSVFVEL